MKSEDPTLVRCLGLGALGFVLMFVAHGLGLLGWMASEGRSLHPPYWWGYVIVYPAAAAIVVRVSRAGWLQTAACLCAPPIIYFLALGVVDGEWLASEGALVGCSAAFALTAAVAYYARNKDRPSLNPE